MWHHVMNRGVDRLVIFRDETDCEKFVQLVAEVSARHGIEVHVQCLMGTHYHLQVRSTEGHLSAFMRDLGGRYARWFNRRHGRRGPLFGGRFLSVVITDDDQLIQTWAYIHRNPADLGVRDLAGYRWSSAAAYVGVVRPPPWLHTETLCGLIAPAEMRRLLARPDSASAA